MLYVKTAAAAETLIAGLPDAVLVNAAGVRLDPACGYRSAYPAFLREWNGTGLSPSDMSDDGLRLAYDRFRSGAMREIACDGRAQAAVLDIIGHVMAGRDVILTVKEARPFRSSRRRLLAELFLSAGVRDLRTDNKIRPGEIRTMDPVTGRPQRNTLVRYAAPDGSGRVSLTVTGVLSDAQKTAILSACKPEPDGRLLFVPASIGLPLPDGVTRRNPWAAFGPNLAACFAAVGSTADAGIHAGHLTAMFKKNAPYWNAMALQQINGWCSF